MNAAARVLLATAGFSHLVFALYVALFFSGFLMIPAGMGVAGIVFLIAAVEA